MLFQSSMRTFQFIPFMLSESVFFLMLGNVFIEDTFRLRENILLSSNNDANEQANQTFRKKRISIKPLIKL